MSIDVKEEIQGLNDTYKMIAQLIGIEDCLILYKNLKGLSITFPTKLIDPQYVKEQIRKKLQEEKVTRKEIQEFAIYYDYSERQIRRFLKEITEEIQEDVIQEENLAYISSWLQKQKEKDDKND